MILEIHDAEVGNTLAGRVNEIDYDYQAEQWVQDIMTETAENGRISERRMTGAAPLAKFILKDDLGERATWDVVEDFGVKLASKTDRFQGEWVLQSVFRK